MSTEKVDMVVGKLTVPVIFKNIKNIHLSVNPPDGCVKVSAPFSMDRETIRVFIISKMGWIRKKQKNFIEQEREEPREFLLRESHYYLGRRFLLNIIEDKNSSGVSLKQNVLEVSVSPGFTGKKIEAMVEKWYRAELKIIVAEKISSFEKIMGIQIASFSIKKMKTRWGSYNPTKNTILLNLDLIKKPIHLIEYIVAHEMVHSFERTHNAKFIAYMDKFMPQWRILKEELNKLPVGSGIEKRDY